MTFLLGGKKKKEKKAREALFLFFKDRSLIKTKICDFFASNFGIMLISVMLADALLAGVRLECVCRSRLLQVTHFR